MLSCGPGPRSATIDSTTATPATTDTVATAPATDTATARGGTLASSLDVSVAEGVRLALHITNTSTQPIEVQFSSGQTHDFAIADTAGREIWRWGDGRMFTQAVQARSLAPGQTVTYEERWDPAGATGRFTVVGRLMSTNLPVEQRLEFSLP